jgi:isopenicillin-N N-acyltransferase-like protein
MASALVCVQAQGTPRQLGLQHGEQCREPIRAFLDHLQHRLQLSREQLVRRALKFLPLFQKHAQHLVDEIHGLADGAAIPFLQALAVQVRDAAGQVQLGACTTFAIAGRATADGSLLIGQNSDMDPELAPLAYVLRLQPRHKPAVLMWTFGGQIGYHGLNAVGVAHFANSLGGGPLWRMALPHYPLKRLMLERHNLAGVLDLLGETPVCSSGNYVVGDAAGRIADVELRPDGFEVIEDDGTGYLVHTNHFLCGIQANRVNHEASLPDSFPRLQRMRQLLAAKAGSLTVADLRLILADHDGHPTSICRHPHTGSDHPSLSARGQTIASLIAEPAAGRLHVAAGNPCTTPYQTYQL